MSDPSDPPRIIHLVRKDTMGRIRFGKLAAHKFYYVDVREDGVIVMKPVDPDAQ